MLSKSSNFRVIFPPPPACFLVLKKSILCLVSVYLGCCNLFLLPFPLAKSINFVCTCKLCQCWQTQFKNNNKNIPKCTKQFAFQLKSLCIKKGQGRASRAQLYDVFMDLSMYFFPQLQHGGGFHSLPGCFFNFLVQPGFFSDCMLSKNYSVNLYFEILRALTLISYCQIFYLFEKK